MAGHDLHALGDGVVEDELRGAVDEDLGSGHGLEKEAEKSTGNEKRKYGPF